MQPIGTIIQRLRSQKTSTCRSLFATSGKRLRRLSDVSPIFSRQRNSDWWAYEKPRPCCSGRLVGFPCREGKQDRAPVLRRLEGDGRS
jgi:hypothetical protein